MILRTDANSFEKELFLERCDVIEFTLSRLPYFTPPIKTLMDIARF